MTSCSTHGLFSMLLAFGMSPVEAVEDFVCGDARSGVCIRFGDFGLDQRIKFGPFGWEQLQQIKIAGAGF